MFGCDFLKKDAGYIFETLGIVFSVCGPMLCSEFNSIQFNSILFRTEWVYIYIQ